MASEKINILENTDLFSSIIDAIKKKKSSIRIPTPNESIPGGYEEMPIKEGLRVLKERGLLSTSQLSEVLCKFNVNYPDEEKFGVDISRIRIRTHEDLETVVEGTHRLSIPIGDGRFLETAEAILWAKEKGISSAQQAKTTLKTYLLRLARKSLSGDEGAKKEIIKTLSFACSHEILEGFEELELMLDVFNFDPDLRDYIYKNTKKDKLLEEVPFGEPLSDLQEVNQEVSRMLDERHIASEEITALKKENARLKRENEDQKDEVLKLELELGELRAANKHQEDIYSETLEKIVNKLEDEERQNNERQETIETLRKAMGEIQKDISEIQEDNDTLKESAQKRDAEKRALSQAIEEKDKEASELQKAIKELQGIIGKLEQRAQKRDTENSSLSQALEEKDKEASKLQDMNRVIKAEEKVALKKIEKLEKDMANLQEHIASLIKERDDLEIKITNILEVGQAEKAELQENVENTKAQKERAEERAAFLSSETLRQQKTLESMEAERNEAQEALETLKEKFSTLEITIVGLQTERSLIARQTQRLKIAILAKRGACNTDQDHKKSRDIV